MNKKEMKENIMHDLYARRAEDDTKYFYHPKRDSLEKCCSCKRGLCKDCAIKSDIDISSIDDYEDYGYETESYATGDHKIDIYCEECIRKLNKKGLSGAQILGFFTVSMVFMPILPLIAWFLWRKKEPVKQSNH